MENREKRRYFLSTGGKRFIRTAVYAALLTAGLYFLLALYVNIWRKYGQSYCMLDCMGQLGCAEVFGLLYLPLTLLAAGIENRIYGQSAFLVQYGSLEQMWRIIFVDILKKAVLFSIIYSSICCILSAFSASEISDWHREGSIFYLANEQTYEGSVQKVFVSFFFANMFKTLFLEIILFLARTSYRSYFLCLIFWSAVIVSEWIYPDMRLFFNLFSITCRNFKWSGTVYLLAVSGAALSWLLYATGKECWRRREFYG